MAGRKGNPPLRIPEAQKKLQELEQRNRSLEAELLSKENQVGRLEGAFLKMRDFINNELIAMRAPPQVAAPAPPTDCDHEWARGENTALFCRKCGKHAPPVEPKKGASDSEAPGS